MLHIKSAVTSCNGADLPPFNRGLTVGIVDAMEGEGVGATSRIAVLNATRFLK